MIKFYQAPFENGIEGFGYPTQLKIYIKVRNVDGTLIDNDSDFLLIEDIISEKTGNMVLFQFEEEITLDQMKLEWAGLEESEERIFPAARIIYFLFKENSYINKLLNFFIENDYTYTSIKPELNDFNVIDELEGKIEEYDILKENYESIKEITERIKKIINKEIEYDPRREFTTNPKAKTNIIHQHGDVAYYTKNTLKMAWGGANGQSTGIYGFAYENITIYVDSNEDEIKLLYIRFSKYRGIYNRWLSDPYELKKRNQQISF